jgi:hypothetical protein
VCVYIVKYTTWGGGGVGKQRKKKGEKCKIKAEKKGGKCEKRKKEVNKRNGKAKERK